MKNRPRNQNQNHNHNQNHSHNHTQNQNRIVIGLHSAREVFKVRPKMITEVWLKEGADKNRDLSFFIEQSKRVGAKVLIKKEGNLDKLAASHQGVAVFVKETPELNLNIFTHGNNDKTLLLALDEVSDPHNVGAALRTAWLLGVKGLIVPENRSAHLTPAVIKVASGAAEHVPILVTSNLSAELTSLKDKGFWIYGLAGEATGDLSQTKFNEKVVLVVGSEGKGLRSTTANVCDELVRIPQVDGDASYNASVAAAISMYEVWRQHKNP